MKTVEVSEKIEEMRRIKKVIFFNMYEMLETSAKHMLKTVFTT